MGIITLISDGWSGGPPSTTMMEWVNRTSSRRYVFISPYAGPRCVAVLMVFPPNGRSRSIHHERPVTYHPAHAPKLPHCSPTCPNVIHLSYGSDRERRIRLPSRRYTVGLSAGRLEIRAGWSNRVRIALRAVCWVIQWWIHAKEG